jgi:hypothetical protein
VSSNDDPVAVWLEEAAERHYRVYSSTDETDDVWAWW